MVLTLRAKLEVNLGQVYPKNWHFQNGFVHPIFDKCNDNSSIRSIGNFQKCTTLSKIIHCGHSFPLRKWVMGTIL